MVHLVITVILAKAAANSEGILVVDNLAIGMAQSGKWRPMDSIYTEAWPKALIPPDVVERITSGGGHLLGPRNELKPMEGGLAFGGEDAAPYERGWTFIPPREGRSVVWFGEKPTAPKVTFVSPTSTTYRNAVTAFMATKGVKNAKPHVHTVVLADLDNNGTQEALIFASSRAERDMSEVIYHEGRKFPNDYSLILIRYVSGKSVRTATAFYTDGKAGSLDGHCSFAGIWNLDGKPGLEFISRWVGLEAHAATIHGFAGGKVIKLAEAGDGV